MDGKQRPKIDQSQYLWSQVATYSHFFSRSHNLKHLTSTYWHKTRWTTTANGFFSRFLANSTVISCTFVLANYHKTTSNSSHIKFIKFHRQGCLVASSMSCPSAAKCSGTGTPRTIPSALGNGESKCHVDLAFGMIPSFVISRFNQSQKQVHHKSSLNIGCA